MDKFLLGATVVVYGMTSWLSKTITSHSIPLAQTDVVTESQLDILPFFKILIDYGLAAGILVVGYFVCCKLIDRIGDRLEKKIENHHDETKCMLNKIMEGQKS